MSHRRFNQTERIAMLWDSGEKCAECGQPLVKGWHGDHVIPSKHGGHTVILNGRAVCPACNLRKGSSMLPWLEKFHQATWGQSVRKWLGEAFQKFVMAPIHRSIYNVTPAAGKTRLGVAIGKWLCETKRADRIVVVCPTGEVCTAWQEDFNRAGILLATKLKKDDPIDLNYKGFCVTYASVCATPWWFKQKFPVKTVVIFDEIHHLEDTSGWGKSARDAFDSPTNYTIGLTGTLWRPKSTESMSFVSYDEQGFIKADYNYGYKYALADGIVRSVSFPTWDAIDEGVRFIYRGKEFTGSFKGEPSPKNDLLWNRTLSCAINPNFPFLTAMVKAANEKLMSPLLRGRSDPNAGGIFFGESIEWLEFIQKEVFKKLGIRSIVVHSGPECDDPKGDIKRFKDDTGMTWVLCAEMISEGVSIPRLRVGVHGCITMTELAFRQKLGRILRRTGTADSEAFYYMPKHPILVSYAEKIEEEKTQAKQIIEDRAKKERKPGEENGPSPFVPLDAHGEESIHIVGSQAIDREYVSFSQSLLQQAGMESVISSSHAAKLLSVAGVTMAGGNVTPQSQPVTPHVVYEEAKAKKSNEVSRLVRSAVKILLGNGTHTEDEKKAEYQGVMERLSDLDGVWTNQRQACTLDQLNARYNHMVNYLKELTRG